MNYRIEELKIGDLVMVQKSEECWFSDKNAGKVGVIKDTNSSGYSVLGVGAWYPRSALILIRSCDYSVPADKNEWEEYKSQNEIWN